MTEAYLKYLRTLPCEVCGKLAEPAHQRFLGSGGTSYKPPDYEAIPLCRDHHDEQEADAVPFWMDKITNWPQLIPDSHQQAWAENHVRKIIIKNLVNYGRVK